MLLLAGILLAFVGVVDYMAGSEVAFSILYLLPVSLLAWFVGRRVGIITSLAAAAIVG